MFFASQFAAVTDLYVTTPTWILVLVWVALAAIGTRLANTANRFVKAAGSLLWAVALLWLVASASYSLFSILWYGRWPSLDLPFSPIVELRGFLNPYLSDWTDDVLFLTPLVTFAMMGAFQREISRPLRIIMATWFVAVLLYCLYYIFVTVFYNPPSTIVIAILFFSQTLFGFASSTGSRYSTAQLIRGLQLRSVNVAASGERWQIVLLTIVVAFWYKYQISKDSLAELYAALFSGLLTIIGFAALIFTFTFERIPTSRMRDHIAQDIKSIFRDVGLVCVFAVIGLLFFSGKDVRFSLRELDWAGAFAVAVLCSSMLGTLQAVDTTIKLFQQLIDVVSRARPGLRDITVAFDEMRTLSADSAMSDTETGFSQLRSYAEDKGFPTVPIERANVAGLSRLERSILVIQRVSTTIPEGDAAVYREFVERGDVLMVVLDAADSVRKESLLAQFNVVARRFSFGEGDASTVTVSSLALKGPRTLGGFHLSLEEPVFLSTAEGNAIVIARSDAADGQAAETVILASRVGAGLAIFVGGVKQWQNGRFSNDNNQDCFEMLLEFAARHISSVRATEQKSGVVSDARPWDGRGRASGPA